MQRRKEVVVHGAKKRKSEETMDESKGLPMRLHQVDLLLEGCEPTGQHWEKRVKKRKPTQRVLRPIYEESLTEINNGVRFAK